MMGATGFEAVVLDIPSVGRGPVMLARRNEDFGLPTVLSMALATWCAANQSDAAKGSIARPLRCRASASTGVAWSATRESI